MTKATAGRPMETRPEGPGTALARFLIDRLPEIGLTNTEVAKRLGYARPNIVTGWKTGQTKFALDNLFKMADLLKVDPAYMLALYLDQYVSDAHSGTDRFGDIVNMVRRMVTAEEWEIISIVREARRGASAPLRDVERRLLKELFSLPDGEADGPYRPLDTLAHLPDDAERTRFARRGFARAMTVAEIRASKGDAPNDERDRGVELRVRFAPDLYRDIERAAREAGMEVSAYVAHVQAQALTREAAA